MKRTGVDAFLAADTSVIMDIHRTEIRVIQGLGGADLDTGRVGAVHAAVFSEQPFQFAVLIDMLLEANKRPGVPLQIRRILVAAGILCL
jgi:hypothetical protein